MSRFTCLMASIGSALLLSACSSGVPTVAQVTTIDRTCTIIERETTLGADGTPRPGKEVRRYKGDCNEVDDWDEVKRAGKRSIDGTAEIHFVYTGPDNKQHNGTLRFTGRDSEFYELKAGDEMKIRVAEDDPTRVWRG